MEKIIFKIIITILVLAFAASIVLGVMGYFKAQSNANEIKFTQTQMVQVVCYGLNQVAPEKVAMTDGGCTFKAEPVVKK